MKFKIGFAILVLLFLSYIICPVKAQTGTGSGDLTIYPTDGPAGTTIAFSYTVDSSYAYLYRDEEFKLVWDIGGWNHDQPADWNTVQNSVWNVIGTAKFDSSGHLSGTAVIPLTSSSETGDHVLYAVSPKIKDGTTMNFWWGWFDIDSTTAVATSTPTPTPGTTPTPIPARDPTKAMLTITLNQDVSVNVQDEHVILPYSAEFTKGTTVKLEVTPTSTLDFQEWRWTDSTGTHGYSDKIIYIDLTEDITVEPISKSSTGIPGFPIESIGLGLIIALTSIYLLKKKHNNELPLSK